MRCDPLAAGKRRKTWRGRNARALNPRVTRQTRAEHPRARAAVRRNKKASNQGNCSSAMSGRPARPTLDCGASAAGWPGAARRTRRRYRVNRQGGSFAAPGPGRGARGWAAEAAYGGGHRPAITCSAPPLDAGAYAGSTPATGAAPAASRDRPTCRRARPAPARSRTVPRGPGFPPRIASAERRADGPPPRTAPGHGQKRRRRLARRPPGPRPGRGQPDWPGPATTSAPDPRRPAASAPTAEETMMSNGRRSSPAALRCHHAGPGRGFPQVRCRVRPDGSRAAGRGGSRQAARRPGQAGRGAGPLTRRPARPDRPRTTGGHQPDGQAEVRQAPGR